MPPIAIVPLLKVTLGALGAAAVVRWAVKEARRVNAELERVRKAPLDPAARKAMPTLRRDPQTGEYRL
jgi:hypothetical protein